MSAAAYRIKYALNITGCCVIPLMPCDEEFAGYTLAPATTRFLQKTAWCAGCACPVPDFTQHESCPRKYDGYDAKVEVAVPDIYKRELRLLFRRESTRQQQFKRLRLLREAGGRHTAAQIRELLRLQEGHCYYCFAGLLTQTGRPSYHRDHFEPVEYGGSDSISNIVLACASCNINKRACDGESFKRSRLRRASIELRAELRRIHRAVKQHEF